MFKQAIWTGVGAAAGAAGTLWTQKKVKAQVAKVSAMATPAHLAETAKSRVTGARDNISAAVVEGRHTKRAAESQMRDQLNAKLGRSVQQK